MRERVARRCSKGVLGQGQGALDTGSVCAIQLRSANALAPTLSAGAETAHGPSSAAIRAASAGAASAKPSRRPARPKNLPNERSTTMLPRPTSGGEARARRPDIHEGFIDHEHAAARAEASWRDASKSRWRTAGRPDCSDWPRSRARRCRARRGRGSVTTVPGKRSRAGVLGIGRAPGSRRGPAAPVRPPAAAESAYPAPAPRGRRTVRHRLRRDGGELVERGRSGRRAKIRPAGAASDTD